MRFILAGSLLALALIATSARAGYSIHSPTVSAGKNSVELKGFNSWGANPASGTVSEMKAAFGRGITDFWGSEIELIGKRSFDGSLRARDLEWENKFQLTPKGKYGVNAGLFTALEYKRGGGWEAEVGPTLAKNFGRFRTRMNLLFSHEYGHGADSGIGIKYALRIAWRWKPTFSPLIEVYGHPVGRTGAWGEPRNLAGPGFTGEIGFGNGRALEYGLVALFGLSGAAADTTLVARLEYAFF